MESTARSSSELDPLVAGLALCWFLASAVLDLYAVWIAFGGLGLVLGLTIAPITFVIAPFYAALVHGFWWPLVVEYGGLVVLGILAWVTERMQC
ncbi:MAG: hypothetical protein NZL87_06685 [Thermomicrobium sp.]|nr:hypothetical protein [Thermomicrobium sp.]MDW8060719.1 hypothetical protein [Thermomicrobium sp.]